MGRLKEVAALLFLCGICFSTTEAQQSAQQQNINEKSCYGQGNYGFQSWTDYYTYWYEMYPNYARVMFPFGTRFCDTNATASQKSTGFNTNIQYTVPYYGMNYETIWVTPSGTIILNNTKNFETPPAYFSGRTWPNPDYPVGGATDYPFVAPFLSQADPRFGIAYEPSQISYRILNTSSDVPSNQLSIMKGMLNFVTQQIRAAVTGTNWFHAEYGVVVTWYELTFQGASCQGPTNPNVMGDCPRNTYQATIVTDGIKTYTVFNYYNITWIGGASASQQCDPATGLPSSSYPNCAPAIMGFNAGDARGFTSLPYSNSTQVENLDKLSGTNVTGRFIYDISGDYIRRGGCTNDTSLAETVWPLEVWPTFGPMLGGQVVNVSGPCFLRGENIKCKFGTEVVDGYYFGNMMQIICIAPRLSTIGRIPMSVSIDGGVNYYFQNYYLVEMDNRMISQLNVTASPSGDWIFTNQITLTWNAKNLTWKDNDRVTIALYGYQEIGEFGEFMSNNWQHIYTYEYSYTNTGTYTFVPSSRPCAAQQPADTCATYTMGAFMVSLSVSNPWNPRGYWSDVIPLGWFANEALRYVHGHSWAAALCKSWYNMDSLSSSWRNYVPACPCTLQQAYVDYGRFFPDTECNLFNHNEAGKCNHHQGAAACYRSINVTSTGAGNTCCYENVHGYLMYSEDTQYGSMSARAHPWGKPPYGQPPYIPHLSHWYHDIMPWYFCCEWQIGGHSDWSEYDCFNRYVPMRPTGDCQNYNPPGFAMSFGDPHFRTFDGTNFTFNSWGEFWLLQIVDAPVTGGMASFSLQGRYQQPKNQTWGQIKATIMTAAAMKLNDGPTISVRINQEYSEQELLLIYVDNEVLNFSLPGQRWHSYQDFFIVNNDPMDEVTYKNFTIAYRLGIGIQVAYANGLMQLMCTLPPTFKTKTNGLFGYWNGNPNNDLVPRQTGSNTGAAPVPPGNTNLQTIHYSFGLTWVVRESETLFTYLYRADLNYNWYHQTWFIPSFQAAFPANNTGISQDQVNSICYSNFPCEYDYMVAQNETWAKDTYEIQKWDTQMRFLGRYRPACGWLATPNAIKQQPICYIAGCAVTLTGCRPKYWLKRNDVKTYTCTQQGTCSPTSSSTVGCDAYWSPTLRTQCEWMPLPPGQLAAAIIPPVLVVLGIIIALIICISLKKKKTAREKAEVAMAKKLEWDFEKFLSGKGPHPGTAMQKERERREVFDMQKKSQDPNQPPRPILGPALNFSSSDSSKKIDSLTTDTKPSVSDSWEGDSTWNGSSINKIEILDTSPKEPLYYRHSKPPSPIPFSSYTNQGHSKDLVDNSNNFHIVNHQVTGSTIEKLPTIRKPDSHQHKKRRKKIRQKQEEPVAVSSVKADTSAGNSVPVASVSPGDISYDTQTDPGNKKRKKRKKEKIEAGDKKDGVTNDEDVIGTAANYYARKYGRRYNYGAYVGEGDSQV